MPCVFFYRTKNREEMKEIGFNLFDYVQMLEAARNELEQEQKELAQEQERLAEKTKRVDWSKQCFEAARDLFAENKKLSEDIVKLQKQLDEEKRQRADLEMNLAETRKLMDSIAKKSSEEGVQKAIQTFVNYSKRKTSDKRTYIKNTILEFSSVNRISLPEELSATIDCLDDEQTEPKSVTMNGGVYNDIHDNKDVNVV